MNKTKTYQLNQWDRTDRILMEDFNRDNAEIDAALAAQAAAIAAEETARIAAVSAEESARSAADAALQSGISNHSVMTLLKSVAASAQANRGGHQRRGHRLGRLSKPAFGNRHETVLSVAEISTVTTT